MGTLNLEEAYAAFAYQAVCEDGMLLREEHDALLEHLSTSPIVTSDPEELLQRVNKHLGEFGSDLLEAAATVIPVNQRQPMYDELVRLSRVDADVAPDEAVFLARAAQLLGINA